MLELAFPAFIMIFFGISAWVVALLSFIGLAPSFNAQLAIFVSVAILSLVLFRKKAKRISRGRGLLRTHDAHETDAIVGSTAVVINDIEANQLGKVELFGTAWQATASETIKKGSTVEIISRNNLVLTVKFR